MCSCLSFCLPVFFGRSSSIKRSNVKTIREVLIFLTRADDETSDLAHSILRSILSELVIRSNGGFSGCLRDTNASGPMVDQCVLKQIALALRRNSYTPPDWTIIQTPPPARHVPSPSERPIQPEPNLTNRQRDRLFSLFSQCSEAQLELLSQMEAVKDWSALILSSRLDFLNDLSLGLPALYPQRCSCSSGGRIRAASWNLNRFTLAKAKHPGFREILCLTILRAQISLLVLQEVASVDVVNVICSELNNPTLPHIKQWLCQNPSNHASCWDAATSVHSVGSMFRSAEFAAFLYDKNSGIRIKRTHLLEPRRADAVGAVAKELRLFSRSPCCALCSIRDERFMVVSVHFKAQGLRHSRVGKTSTEAEAMTYLVQAFKETQPAGTNLIVLGDFNLNPDHEAFSGLRNHGLSSVLKGNQPTTVASAIKANVISGSNGNAMQSQNSPAAYDNAWISSSAFYTGDCGVITNGLRHPLIPDDKGAGANGFISDHCPIWFDFMIP
ncbi:Endonuclease/exonuclease/phosphatase family domain-containing protein 1 [Fasciola gigantica]|uniref:Endonuclease/exonuclease/phosphatase family domain-containing protein 1 n=1 Tax=Fasciola gigantica TaxID=46835 RepID=A0A504ZB53_FASGI|nr:Endonuclease/exonuclease/phosphatase family domain-containing protein 1 [Fasciola gigantica]